MRRSHGYALIAGTAALAAAAVAAWAAPQQQRPKPNTPEGWSYELRDGKRVPRGEKTVNPDGSWREVVRRGKCETIRERSAQGEFREKTRCDD